MTSKTKYIVGLVLLLSLVFAAVAMAADTYTPTTTWNVIPLLKTFPGDQACPEGSFLVKDQFQSLNANSSMTYVLDGSTVTVEVTYVAEGVFDFNVIGGSMSQLFVKSKEYLLYQYEPPVAGATNTGPVSYDTDVHANAAPNGKNYNGVSHLDLCLMPGAPLEVTKTAAGSYDRTVEWTLDKTVDDNAHRGYAGMRAGTSNWEVVVTKTETLDNYKVTGEIWITNPNGFPVDFSVEDTLDDGTTAVVTCPNDVFTVAANATVVCTYEAFPEDDSATLNTAVVTSLTSGIDGDTATAAVSFTENLIGYDEGTLYDDRFGYEELISGNTTESFEEDFYCSADASDYTNGYYEYTETNTAVLNGNIGLEDSATVTVDCYLDALVPTKTAVGRYDRTVTWTLDKLVQVGSLLTEMYNFYGEAGDNFYPDWKLYVDKTEIKDNYLVTGSIYIWNPATIAQTFDVYDTLDDTTTATVTCPSYTVEAGQTVKCTYTANATENATTNYATVTAAGNLPQSDEATFIYQENLIGVDSGTLTDDRFPSFNETVNGDAEFTLPETFTCSTNPADYTDGSYTQLYNNEGQLVVDQTLTDTAAVELHCSLPALMVEKSAAGTYDRTVTWTLDKVVQVGSLLSKMYNFYGDAGDEFYPDWKLYVTKSEVYENYQVTGEIEIYNPAAIAQTFTVSDTLDDGTTAVVSCPSYTVDPLATVTCTYTADATVAAEKNTATVTAPGNLPQSYDATFNYVEQLNGVDSGTLTDDRFPSFNETVNDDANFTLPETFTCSSDPSDYTEGFYTQTYNNEGQLVVDQTLTDTAAVKLNCTLPPLVVSKTADGTYDRTVTWDLAKYVDPALLVGAPGTVFDPVQWTVVATKSEALGNYQVTGNITITNPSAVAQKVTSIWDVLSDNTYATVDCGAALPIWIAAGGELVCSYTASPASGAATLNTATIMAVGNPNQKGTAPVSFTENLIGEDQGTLSDPLFGFSTTISSSTTGYFYSYPVCPPSGDALYVDGQYEFSVINWAYLNGNIGLDASATFRVLCEEPEQASIQIEDVRILDADKDLDTASGTFIVKNMSGGDITYVTLGDVWMEFVAKGRAGVTGYFDGVCSINPAATGAVLAPHEAKLFSYNCSLVYASGALMDLSEANELTAVVYVDGAWNQAGEFRDKLWHATSTEFKFTE